MSKVNQSHLIHNVTQAARRSIEQAYELGQSEDVAALKTELDETLKHSQEAYEFFKVVMCRLSTISEKPDSTTISYIRAIGENLAKVKGIKK